MPLASKPLPAGHNPVQEDSQGVCPVAVLDAGAGVVIASSTQSKVDDALARLDSASASGRILDVASEKQSEGFFANVGHFDHLVYTAGDFFELGPFENVSLLCKHRIRSMLDS